MPGKVPILAWRTKAAEEQNRLKNVGVSMYQKIQSDIAQDYCKLNFPNGGQRFVAWYVRNIHAQDSSRLSQRPNLACSETRIFDKYVEQLFKRDYSPEKVQALQEWMALVDSRWTKDNPLGFNETLLAMCSCAPFHHLFAISLYFSVASKRPDHVPAPDVALQRALEKGIADWVVIFAGIALKSALQIAANEVLPDNRVFSPNNWMKAKSSLTGVANVVQTQLTMLPEMGAKDQCDALVLDGDAFECCWQAD